MTSIPITSWQRDGEKTQTVTDYFLGLQNHRGVTAATKLKHLTPIFWPREFHGLYSQWGSQRVRHN